jgi:hypothetical protein
MQNATRSRAHGLPSVEEATTFSVPRAPLAGFPEEARVKTLLRSIAVLEEWLEDNEEKIADELRIRRMKRWRAEALKQLRIELNRTSSPRTHPRVPAGSGSS